MPTTGDLCCVGLFISSTSDGSNIVNRWKLPTTSTPFLCIHMAITQQNRVKMIGPKGKISYVSRKASQSKHLANLGFMVAHDQGPEAVGHTPSKAKTASDGSKA